MACAAIDAVSALTTVQPVIAIVAVQGIVQTAAAEYVIATPAGQLETLHSKPVSPVGAVAHLIAIPAVADIAVIHRRGCAGIVEDKKVGACTAVQRVITQSAVNNVSSATRRYIVGKRIAFCADPVGAVSSRQADTFNAQHLQPKTRYLCSSLAGRSIKQRGPLHRKVCRPKVIAETTIDHSIAHPAGQCVVAPIADQRVVQGTAAQPVIAGPTGQIEDFDPQIVETITAGRLIAEPVVADVTMGNSVAWIADCAPIHDQLVRGT